MKNPDPVQHQTDFAPGGVKHDEGKTPWDLLPYDALEVVSLVLEYGRQKYAAHNWRKGIAQTRLIRAAIGHLQDHLRHDRSDNDEESGLPHLAHAACCCLFLIAQRDEDALDDRFKGGPEADERIPYVTIDAAPSDTQELPAIEGGIVWEVGATYRCRDGSTAKCVALEDNPACEYPVILAYDDEIVNSVTPGGHFYVSTSEYHRDIIARVS